MLVIFCLGAGARKGEKCAKTNERYDAEKFILGAASDRFFQTQNLHESLMLA